MEYILGLCLILLVLIIFIRWQNNSIVVSNINYKCDKISNSLKILHVSDLHNKSFGKGQAKIISKIEEINPDVILITGDTVDCHHPNLKVAQEFIERAYKVAPVYLVSGNHEHYRVDYKTVMRGYKLSGANLLDDKFISLENGEKIKLFGVSDLPPLQFGKIDDKTINSFENKLEKLSKNYDKDCINILLAHRPELIELYSKYGFDLVLSGHAHGGQFRFLFIKGIIAPGQGLFPKYTSGIYKVKNTDMIVSRGLGNSIIPIRIFNRPELVVINLEK